MTSSPDGGTAPPVPDDLPPALSSMWRLCKLGYRYEPGLLAVAFVLSLAAALPDALLALWLKLLGEGALDRDRRLLVVAAIGLGVSASATWILRTMSSRVQRRFRDKVTIALESHVARLQASVATIAHQERPDYLDRLTVLRDQVFVLDHMYMSLFSTAGWILRLAVTVGLLMSIHPALAVLAVFALPTVLTSTWRPAVERSAEERGAQSKRLARHLFGGAYVGAVVLVSSGLDAGAGDVLLVLAAGSRLSSYIGATVGEIGFLRGVWMDGSRRLAWLEDYAAALAASADQPVPAALAEGIRLEHISFAYPGTDRLVLDDVCLDLPAGTVVAIVGENGAGKTTLVKLLCKLYEPTSGRILVDGVPLARMPADEWRSRLAGAFQDFFRFEFRARHSVGVGDVHRLDDHAAVMTAVDRAGADDVVARLPAGLQTQLGPTWPDGVEVSFGQWQKLALARGFMRERPLLLILDEPTAALDAETEHALFQRYAAAAQNHASAGGGSAFGGSPAGAPHSRITILVSHRFSTVRMADLIVVLDGARVLEVGSHHELMAKEGQYAELYGIQAAAYR